MTSPIRKIRYLIASANLFVALHLAIGCTVYHQCLWHPSEIFSTVLCQPAVQQHPHHHTHSHVHHHGHAHLHGDDLAPTATKIEPERHGHSHLHLELCDAIPSRIFEVNSCLEMELWPCALLSSQMKSSEILSSVFAGRDCKSDSLRSVDADCEGFAQPMRAHLFYCVQIV